MVFYFSGTGNSYHVAKKLAEGLGEKMIDMARATREDAYEYTLRGKTGLCVPCSRLGATPDGGAVCPASGTVL